MLRSSIQGAHKWSFKVVIKNNENLLAKRNIFVLSSDRRKKFSKTKKITPEIEKIDKFISAEEERQFQRQEAEYKRKLSELRSLTTSVSRMIRRKEEIREEEERIKNLPMPSDMEKQSETIYKSLEAPSTSNEELSKNPDPSSVPEAYHPSKHLLVVPSIDIPDSISERLGLSVKFLVSKTHQNWQMVLKQLQQAGGFKDIPTKDVRKFINNIPKQYIPSIMTTLESLLDEAKIQKTSKIINVFIESLVSGPTISDERMGLIEKYCENLKSINKKGRIGRDTYELLIRAFGKRNDLDKINICLEEMAKLNLEPSPRTFSNILSTCVYKARDHKQATEIFDSMKFLSQKTKPNTIAYQNIIVSNINNDSVEKALDLYQEMISEGIAVNQKIMVALARGCTSRPALKFKAWDFIFEIYNSGWEPTLETYEYMIYLSAKDGDIALARALYSKLNSSDSATPRAFSFLMLSYAKSHLRSENAMEAPVITFHEKGRLFRRNILSDTDLAAEVLSMPSEKDHLPFLPVLDMSSKEEIMAETSALWAHTLIFNPQFINTECTNIYLNIAAEMGKLSDFIDRFDSATALDNTGLNETRVIIEEPEEDFSQDLKKDENSNRSLAQLNFEEASITKSPLLKELSENSKRYKVARTSLSYVIALKAAAKSRNYKFAKRIWSERGEYRKTNKFKSLSREVKDRLDFEFASAMVSCLTKMKLLEDAAAILISTEYQFRWTWKELNELYRACVEIGNDSICRTIRAIAKRAQINYEGKIRRKDYKRYVMERGF